MIGLLKKFSSGDTIIEVLIAVTVFSMVAVGGISIMNQGAATAQRSLEITLVRQEIDAQAEALRFLNANYVADFINGKASYVGLSNNWLELSGIADSATTVSPFGISKNEKCDTLMQSDNAFVINTKTLAVQPIKGFSSDDHSVTYSKINYARDGSSNISSIDGLWIEAIKGKENLPSTTTDYIDFHIRACWEGIGQSTPMTIGTIVRLYEPHNT